MSQPRYFVKRITLKMQRLLLVILLVSVAAQVGRGQRDEEHASRGHIEASGIWVQGNTILLFANATACSGFYPPPGIALLLVSTDGGRTWKKNGPALPGYEFKVVFEKGEKVWIAGDHTCEGPPEDPIIFVPVGENKWEFHKIHEGNEFIDHLGWTANGELAAWITEMRLEDLEPGRTWVHRSLDGGRTWKQLGLARKHKISVEAQSINIRHRMQPLWRVVNSNREVLIQHKDTESSRWKTISRLSSWRCPGKKPQLASK